MINSFYVFKITNMIKFNILIIILVLFRCKQIFSFNRHFIKYKERNTNISCYDDLDCQNITIPITKKNLIDMDMIYTYSCILNRCVRGHEFVNKFKCDNYISKSKCSNICNNNYKLYQTPINDCCQCLIINDRTCNKNIEECINSNTDYVIKNNFHYCENDLLRTSLFCNDNLLCQYKCFDIFGDGIYGYCSNKTCICYRKHVEKKKILTKENCLSISKALFNVNFVHINNICIFSKYPNSLNKCNYTSCDTFCNYETGKCLIAL